VLAGGDAIALDDADGEPDEVELAGGHRPRVLGHLAAEQRAPAWRQPAATPSTSCSTWSGSSCPTAM
jgi:hypothetical protein